MRVLLYCSLYLDVHFVLQGVRHDVASESHLLIKRFNDNRLVISAMCGLKIHEECSEGRAS
jgi:hypothetical protein